ncbi:putative methyltransferase [Pelagibacter phage Mosig EXVC030M]|nr:putative methyltransferase [Pelagibacter phage Mosig EXVC030M]
MKQVKGWWLPDWDNHYDTAMTNVGDTWVYQQEQRDYALSYVKNFNLALDIGGNIGFWSQDLCKKFKTVKAIEPHPDNIECYRKNMIEFTNWQLDEVALSDHQEENAVLFQSPDESGNVSLNSHGVTHGNSIRTLKEEQLTKTYTDVKMLDDYISEFEGQNIDFIKVDCQEHEKEIVSGGLDLLSRNDTVLCLELPRRNQLEHQQHNDVVNILSGIGYRRRGNMRKETIFTK